MSLEIIPVYKCLDEYIDRTQRDAGSYEKLWHTCAIEPYWKTLCQYAPFDLSDRKPGPIKDIATLKRQIELLNCINLDELKLKFEEIAAALPNYDDDTITIALYPLPDDNQTAKERQNGVIGTSTFGNMIIAVNPLARDFTYWIPYVFAHEYHHTVWGNYWFNHRRGELKNQFLESLIIDGQADCFALSFFPELKPTWLFDLSDNVLQALWEEKYSKLLFQKDVDYCKYMFGDQASGIPWCAGYAIGYKLVRQFLFKNPAITFRQLTELTPSEILV